MPQLKINLSDLALTKIQLAVDDFNIQTGQSLTLDEFVVLSLAQKAIEKELVADVDTIKKAHDNELPRLIDARRRKLLASLGSGDVL